MYIYTPKNDRRVAITASAACFSSAILLFMPNSLDPSLSTLLRCLGIWLFVCGFLVLERYVLTVFTYTLKDCHDGLELTITETRLKKQRTVGRVMSGSFVSLTEKIKHTPRKGVRRYNYCPDPFGSDRYVLLIEDGDGISEVTFRPDGKIVQIINAVIV